MIQQVCLTRSKMIQNPDFDEPIELVINPKDCKKFKGTMKVLFDKKSVKRIMKERRK